MLQQLGGLIDDHNIDRLVDSSDRELLQREEEQFEDFRREVGEIIRGDMSASKLAPFLSSVAYFNDSFILLVSNFLQRELLLLRKDVKLAAEETLLLLATDILITSQGKLDREILREMS